MLPPPLPPCIPPLAWCFSQSVRTSRRRFPLPPRRRRALPFALFAPFVRCDDGFKLDQVSDVRAPLSSPRPHAEPLSPHPFPPSTALAGKRIWAFFTRSKPPPEMFSLFLSPCVFRYLRTWFDLEGPLLPCLPLFALSVLRKFVCS